MKLKIQKPKAGFTVLESIVAITLVSLAIAGAFTAVQAALSSSSQAKEQVKAFYLAQEAIEMLRNRRDSNNLLNLSGTPTHWLHSIAESSDNSSNQNPCYFGNTCMVDTYSQTFYRDNALGSCTGWHTCPPLMQDPTSALYGYVVGWTTSIYTREIQLEQTSNPDEIEVTVLISWVHGIIDREFKTKTILTKWF